MTEPSSWLYLGVFVAALAGGALLTAAARRLAHRMGVVDATALARPDAAGPVPLLGGLAIYGGAVLAAWNLVPGARHELKGLFLAGLVILVFGMADDVSAMDPWLKLVAQATSALVLAGFGVQVHLTGVDVVDVALTVLWVVAVVNAVNYQDNVDGLAAGLAAVSCLGLFALAVTESQYLVAVLSVGVAGGALGFLRSNFPIARQFMGDAGSMFLGFVLAFLGIRIHFLDQPKSAVLAVPLLVVAVPLFDALMVTLSRARRGTPVTRGGKDHTSHRLIALGLTPTRAVAALWGVQAVACAAALAVARLGPAVDVAVLLGSAAAGGAALLARPLR